MLEYLCYGCVGTYYLTFCVFAGWRTAQITAITATTNEMIATISIPLP